ncbi:MAG TPA: peroxiredoxin [Verrucomicrobiae bacterium]
MKIKLLLIATLFVSAATAFADKPKVGDAAPSFSGLDQNGQMVTLADFAGKTNVLLYFYPKDFTGGCTKEACGFRDRLGELQTNNVAVIGVSYDSAESHQKFAVKYSLNFPLLADTNGVISQAYDVKMPMLKMDKRVSFLIGKDGKVLHVTDASSPEKHFDEMKIAIAELK